MTKSATHTHTHTHTHLLKLIIIITTIITILTIPICAHAATTDWPGTAQSGDITGNQAQTHINLKIDDSKLSFTAPTIINYCLDGAGNFITPDPGVAHFKNNSIFNIKVNSYDVTAQSGAKGVADVAGETGADTWMLNVAGNDNIKYPFAVDSPSNWPGWLIQKTGATGDTCGLTFTDGKMINTTASKWHNGANLESVEWNISSEAGDDLCNVNYNSMGGSTVPDSVVKKGGTISAPVDPTREGYDFLGWYSDPTCTIPFNFSNPINVYTNVFAKWEKLLEPKTNPKVKGGTLTLSPKYVRAGDTVTVTGTPEKDDEVLNSVKVTKDSTGERVESSPVIDNQSSFVHPDSNVTVNATFGEPPEAYAVVRDLDDGTVNGLLEFRYDGERGSFPADHTFDCEDTGGNCPWALFLNNLRQVNFNDSFKIVKVKNCKQWFEYASNLGIFIGTENFDTSEVTDMSGMFQSCGDNAELFNLDFSYFNADNVTDLSSMFQGCGYNSKNTSINLSHFSAKNASTMKNMFLQCGYNSENTNIDITYLDGSNAIDLSQMFLQCGYSSDTNINLSNFNASEATNLFNMFYCCGYQSPNFIKINSSNFKISKAQIMTYMFQFVGWRTKECNLGDMTSWDVSSVTNMDNMFFQSGYNAESFIMDVSNWNLESLVSARLMFQQCACSASVKYCEIGDLNTWQISNIVNMESMFQEAFNTRNQEWTLDLSNWDTSKCLNMKQLFHCMDAAHGYFKEIDITGWTFNSNTVTKSMFFGGLDILQKIYYDKDLSTILTTENSSSMFGYCNNLPHYDSNFTDKTYAYPDNGETGYFTLKSDLQQNNIENDLVNFVNETGNELLNTIKNIFMVKD